MLFASQPRKRASSPKSTKILSLLGAIILTASAAHGQAIVISEVYGGGGNTGSPLKNDFIELYNSSLVSVDLTGWSVQYASSAGTSWAVTPLTSFTLLSGQYYLIREGGGLSGVDLPTPDAVGTIAMSAVSGKVALVNTTTALTGSTPSGSQIIDVVGYGTSNFFEGSGPAPAITNTTSDSRLNGGLTDTGNNAADFISGAPAPLNSASFQAVPEPGTLGLALLGFVALVGARRGFRIHRRA